MKRFEVYRNIRKGAVIFGLPISFFALLIVAVVGSLLVIIFSFSFKIVLTVFVLNAGLYVILTRMASNPQLFQVSQVFPKIITAKRTNHLPYEQD